MVKKEKKKGQFIEPKVTPKIDPKLDPKINDPN